MFEFCSTAQAKTGGSSGDQQVHGPPHQEPREWAQLSWLAHLHALRISLRGSDLGQIQTPQLRLSKISYRQKSCGQNNGGGEINERDARPPQRTPKPPAFSKGQTARR